MSLRWQLHSTAYIALAFFLLMALAAQYPLKTSFPIGGDGAAYSRSAKSILSLRSNPKAALDTLRQSNYPLAQGIYTAAGWLPVSWPERFTIMMTLAHVAAGLALAALLYRLQSSAAAAAGVAIWALSIVGVNTHIEDATFAQLLSITFLLLTLERAVAASAAGTLLLLILTWLTHPLSGLVLFFSLSTAVIPLSIQRDRLTPRQRFFTRTILLSGAVLAVGALVKIIIGFEWPGVESEPQYALLDLLKSKFAPWLALALVGVSVLSVHAKQNVFRASVPLSFAFFAVLLAANSLSGIGVAENRFRTYLITAIALLAAVALPHMLQRAFASRLIRVGFALLLFSTLAVLTWRDNASVYAYYEYPGNNGRLSDPAQQALAWAEAHLPAGSHIVTTAANRHSEWIPVLTDHQWTEVNAQHEILTTSGAELEQTVAQLPFTYFLIFLDREDRRENMSDTQLFPRVYENSDVIIIQLK